MKALLGRVWRHFMHDSLYRNSIFLMANTGALAGFGFLFWTLAAHYYSPGEIGITASIITASTLVATISTFGLDNSFIRFLPKSKDPQAFMDTGILFSALASLVAGMAYVVIAKLFIPELSLINNSIAWAGIFVAFMAINTANTLTNFAFIAFRKSHLILLVNLAFGVLRLAALIGFGSLAANGLVASQIVATTVALALTLVCMRLYLNYRLRLRISKNVLRKVARYAGGNYVAAIFSGLPGLLLPTILVSKLSADAAAYYYLVVVIVALLNIIPIAISQSLFAEASWEEEKLGQHFRKALKAMLLIMIPAILVVIALGKPLLHLFGSNYAQQGYGLLVLLSLTNIPKVFSYLLGTILRVTKHVHLIIYNYAAYAVVMLGSTFLYLSHGSSLNGIGWVTLGAESLLAILFGAVCYHLFGHQAGLKKPVEKISPKA